MYLKKLNLFGFKSFANKTELIFEPGVTAVVGPNGCGKSNISDGIKWVLGEQSAKELRGSKMEDIIFNGTDNTEPVNLAEVSLTLSNKDRILPVDYDEVIITRRVFRSGESEYLLNKTQVRLKDIMAMLAGTGIGVSSYSVAEQGKMDRVLSARPEDRREIFEEASGITKYKTQKKEALNKLEHTENNLIRLADIINEVRRQINSIERQARKAEKYRLEFENLKTLDVKLSLHEYNKIKDEESSIKNNNESLKQKEGQLSLELNVQQDELRIHRAKINSVDEKIAETRQKMSEASGSIDKNENTIRLYRERIEELASRDESLTREIADIDKRYAGLKEKIGSVESEFNLINSERENKQNLLTQREVTLETVVNTIKECEKTISESKITVMDKASEHSRLKNDMGKIVSSIVNLASRHRRLNIEKDNITREKESIEQKLTAAEELFAQQVQSFEEVLQQLNSLKNVFEQLKNNSKEKSAVIEKLKQRFASSGSKLELLKDLKEKREGFSEGVKAYIKFIEDNPKQKESFIGIVADMIEPEEGFVGAVEFVLGENSQTIVVRSKDAAKEALDFLAREKKGRAQFIAIDELSSIKGNLTNFRPPSVISRLVEFIKVADEHKPLLEYMLRDSYLVEDIDSDPRLRRYSAKLVTKDGNMADGIISSGGTSLSEEYTGIIGRDAKIKELSNEVATLTQSIASYEAEYIQMMHRLEQMQNEVTTVTERAKKEEIKLSGAEAERSKIKEQRDNFQKEFDLIELELEEVTEEESSLKSREEVIKQELDKIEAEQESLEALINESQATIAQERIKKEEVVIKLTEIRTQMSLVNEKYDSQNATLTMLKDSLRNEEAAAEDRKHQSEEARNRSYSLNADIERLTQENGSLTSAREIINAELTKLQDERRSVYSLVDEIDNKARNSQKNLDELRSSISTYHINVNELNHHAGSIKERIHTTYRIDLDEEGVVFDGTEDWQKVREEVAQLKEGIERMGSVNLIAIEEHKELQDRYEFLTTQQNDLLNAKESLHKAINKINRTTRKMFIDTFEQIKIAFKEYFKLLFGGGTAELFLMDQADILESGIDIVVRPPGKKLQNISLLSGGEKALTSIALLFALFKVRPTPFCVLDEIDAPLDEANIERFSRMLQEFLSTTQFIIITHSKKTIAVSDIMYGITMERSGVSKIVSVKFTEEHKGRPNKEQAKNQPAKEKIEDIKEPVKDINAAEPVADETKN